MKTDQPIYLYLRSGPEAFRVLSGGVVLEPVLQELLAREPDNPFVAVFAPLIIANDAELSERAPALWQSIQQAPLAQDIRETLSSVLEFWFFERYKDKTEEEIWAMLTHI